MLYNHGLLKPKRMEQLKKQLNKGYFKPQINQRTDEILSRKKQRLKKQENGSTDNLDFYFAEEVKPQDTFVIELTDSEYEDVNRPNYDSTDSEEEVDSLERPNETFRSRKSLKNK
jgi:hypothetical protein